MSRRRSNGKAKGNKPSKRTRDLESVAMESKKHLDDGDLDRRRGRDPKVGGDNDWTWYAPSAQMVSDVASYPFSVPTGTRYFTGANFTDQWSVPGIMAYYWHPSVGVATAETSPVNMAMRRFFTLVRKSNSGATNYEAPDLFMYIMACDGAVSFYHFMRRCYGILLNYTMFNRYTPRALLGLMGVDIDDLHSKMADFRMYINQYAYKLNSLAFPNSLSYMARHAWMNDGIYLDGTTAKAQMYLYVAASFYRLTTETQGETPVQVFKVVNYPWMPNQSGGGSSFGNLKKLDDIITFGNAQLQPLLTNQAINIMSGDIEKAFGDGGLYKLPGITDDYNIVPEYNMEVLSQMENLTLQGIVNSGAVSTAITQTTAIGTGYLVSAPTTASFFMTATTNSTVPTNMSDDPVQTADRFKYGQFLNFHISPVIPPNVMVATRGISASHSNGFTVNSNGWSESITVDSCGSELFTYAVIAVNSSYTITDQTSVVTLTYPVSSVCRMFSTQYALSAQDNYLWDLQAMLATFDWHPDIRMTRYDTSGKVIVGPRIPNMDLDNYTILTPGNIQNLHSTALLAELTIGGGLNA